MELDRRPRTRQSSILSQKGKLRPRGCSMGSALVIAVLEGKGALRNQPGQAG